MQLPDNKFTRWMGKQFANLVDNDPVANKPNPSSNSGQSESSILSLGIAGGRFSSHIPIGEPKKNTNIGIVLSGRQSRFLDLIQKDFIEPQSVLDKCLRADVTVLTNPALKTGIQNIAYSMGGVFNGINVISAPRKKKIQDILDQLILRIKLKRYLPEFIYRGLLYGNGYKYNKITKISNTEGRIDGLIYIPPHGMMRLSDDVDEFIDTEEAYAQADLAFGAYNRKSHAFNVAIKDKSTGKLQENTGFGFDLCPEYMLDMWRFFNVPGERYGHSLIEATLYSGIAERYASMLFELFFQRRLSRPLDVSSFTSLKDQAPLKYTDDQIKTFLETISKNKALAEGRQLVSDTVMIDGVMNRLASNENTDKVTDVELIGEDNLAETHSTPQMIHRDRQANVGVLVEKYRHRLYFEKELTPQVNDNLDGTVRKELALHGVDPDDIEYQYNWGQNYLIQDLLQINQQAGNDRKNKRIPQRVSLKVASWLYDDDPVKMQEELDKEDQDDKAHQQEQMKNGFLFKQQMNNNELVDESQQSENGQNQDPNNENYNANTTDQEKDTKDSFLN